MAEKEKGEVEMPKGEFVKEHKKLSRVLKHGTESERKEEGKKQGREARKHASRSCKR